MIKKKTKKRRAGGNLFSIAARNKAFRKAKSAEKKAAARSKKSWKKAISQAKRKLRKR